jgi:hypothetical protein
MVELNCARVVKVLKSKEKDKSELMFIFPKQGSIWLRLIGGSPFQIIRIAV